MSVGRERGQRMDRSSACANGAGSFSNPARDLRRTERGCGITGLGVELNRNLKIIGARARRRRRCMDGSDSDESFGFEGDGHEDTFTDPDGQTASVNTTPLPSHSQIPSQRGTVYTFSDRFYILVSPFQRCVHDSRGKVGERPRAIYRQAGVAQGFDRISAVGQRVPKMNSWRIRVPPDSIHTFLLISLRRCRSSPDISQDDVENFPKSVFVRPVASGD